MFKKVLVPLDIDDLMVSAGVLPYVSCLANGLKIPVVLTSVLDSDSIKVPLEVAKGNIQDLPQTIEEAKFNVELWLQRAAAQLSEQGVLAEAVVFPGDKPAEGILQLAETHGCDLIAMATHDRNLLGQAIKGSVTNEVLRSSPVPVLAITPEKKAEFPKLGAIISRVLVPLDGTPFAEAVLPYVEYLAKELSLEVLLIRVLEFRDIDPPMGGVGMTESLGYGPGLGVQALAEEAAEAEIVKYLDGIAERLKNKGLAVRWELVRGAGAAQSIAGLAKDTSGNIIALTSHGRSGVSRWVLGSMAEELLRATGDPVLVVPSALVEEE